MAFIHVKRFLGCLPLRAGVWVLSLTGLMLGAAGATGSWFEVQKIEDHPIEFQDEIALFTQAIVFSLYAVFSLVGLVAGLGNNRVLAHVYSRLTAVHFVLMVLSLGFTLYYTFHPVSNGVIFNCTAGDPDQLIVQFCGKGWSLVKGIPIIAYAVSLLVQCYSFVIAVNFVEQHELDEASRWSGSFKFGPPDDLDSQSYLVDRAKREKLNL